jgi:hypothetical protein
LTPVVAQDLVTGPRDVDPWVHSQGRGTGLHQQVVDRQLDPVLGELLIQGRPQGEQLLGVDHEGPNGGRPAWTMATAGARLQMSDLPHVLKLKRLPAPPTHTRARNDPSACPPKAEGEMATDE